MKRHWYSVKFSYMAGGKELFSKTCEVGLVCQSDILRHRKLKQQLCGFIRDERVKPLLCSGQIHLHVVTYMGRFNGGGPNLREYLAEKFGDLFTGYFIWQARKAL